MKTEYTIVHVEKPEEEAWGIIGRGLHEYNLKHAGDQEFKRLCYVLQSADQEITGGVIAELYWGWLYIDLMWIREELRDQGYGTRLLSEVENDAKERGAKSVYLDTFSFQAIDFYKKHGYKIEAELPDFPAGHQRYFLSKELD
jgi:ribosomal protein S18 acetylase RimI-like enzyme